MYGSGKDRTWTEKRPPTIGLCVNNRQPAQRMGCPAIVSTELLFIAMFYYSYGSCYCIIGKLIADDAPADNIDSTSMIGTLATSFLVLQAVACVDYSNNHENSNDDYFCKNIIHSTWYVRAGTDPPLSLVPCQTAAVEKRSRIHSGQADFAFYSSMGFVNDPAQCEKDALVLIRTL